MISRLERTLEDLPRAFPGPGGAAAVLRDGEVIAKAAWGFANAERRLPFTSRTLFRICSISKQFTCAAMLDAFPDPSVLDGDVRARLPNLEGESPSALRLAHNQSGLRDYWAVAMLHGAPAERPFGEAEAARVIAGERTLQFAPGTRYSYCNQNFRMLGDILQERLGKGFGEIVRERVFDRAGMETATLAADTSAMPDGTEGYEGNPSIGFRPAVNRIVWTGDAGLAASLDDMIAWERHIDTTRDDPASLHARLSAPAAFVDGAPAAYGFGLRRSAEVGRAFVGHGGALRGWRSFRFYAPAERTSVVVLFNHLTDAHDAAIELFAASLGEERPRRAPMDSPPPWLGAYIEPETGLSARIEPLSDGVRLRFGHSPEELALTADGARAENDAEIVTSPGGLRLLRPAENLSTRLDPLAPPTLAPIEGRYRCAELDAELTIAGDGQGRYGAFSGFLGEGRMELLTPIGADVWALPCPRALDHTPPGDWTLAFHRDGDEPPGRVTVGCWLARGLLYERVGPRVI